MQSLKFKLVSSGQKVRIFFLDENNAWLAISYINFVEHKLVLRFYKKSRNTEPAIYLEVLKKIYKDVKMFLWEMKYSFSFFPLEGEITANILHNWKNLPIQLAQLIED